MTLSIVRCNALAVPQVAIGKTAMIGMGGPFKSRSDAAPQVTIGKTTVIGVDGSLNTEFFGGK